MTACQTRTLIQDSQTPPTLDFPNTRPDTDNLPRQKRTRSETKIPLRPARTVTTRPSTWNRGHVTPLLQRGCTRSEARLVWSVTELRLVGTSHPCCCERVAVGGRRT